MTYRSYAKLNLYLEVIRRRRDGFHAVETVFQTVSVADELSFEPRAPRGISLESTCPDLPCDDSNLVCRAASLLQRRTGAGSGVDVRLVKRIPMAAGLGGGSGNAAAALIALNGLWRLGLTRRQLRQLALELGADVPYFLVGGTAAATGRGDELTPLPTLPETWFVLVHPGFPVLTAQVYGKLRLERASPRPFAGRTGSFRRALRALASGDWASAIFNRLKPLVFAEHPELAQIEERLLGAGCLAAGMSGSGPTMFGVCDSRERAEQIAPRLAGFTDCRASIVRSVPAAVELLDNGA